MRLEVDFDSRVEEALRRSPAVMRQHLDDGLARGARETTDAAKRRAPKAFTTLTNSIREHTVGELHYEVRPAVHYAKAVEDGVDGPLRSMPNLMGLSMWVRRKLGVSDIEDAGRIAFAIGRKLQREGIKAQPYMKPAFEEKQNRVRAILKGEVARGLAEVFGG